VRSKQIGPVVIFALLGFAGTGCTHGPQTKDKSLLESFNGKHYDSFDSIGGFPIINRHRANVNLTGRVNVLTESIPSPISHVELLLIQESKVLGQAWTNGDGSFTLSGDFPDGPAILRLGSNKYVGELPIQIRGFELKDIEIFVQPR
jgi:hypothetical protein